jgi:hypothetical protein
MSITVNYKDKLSSEDVRTSLLQDKYRWMEAASDGASSGRYSALAVGNLDKKASFEPACHHCQKPGHIRLKCPELK